MPLCREIVEAHGGTIRAASSEGVGSVFTVELPDIRPAVLVVNSDLKELFIFREELEKLDADVYEAANGREALERMGRKKPHLVITDINMPVMGGFDLLRRLKEREDTRAIPVIIVSAAADRETMLAGFSLGAADFIAKPVSASDFPARIARFVGKSETA